MIRLLECGQASLELVSQSRGFIGCRRFGYALALSLLLAALTGEFLLLTLSVVAPALEWVVWA
jgi:hypothetical protein